MCRAGTQSQRRCNRAGLSLIPCAVVAQTRTSQRLRKRTSAVWLGCLGPHLGFHSHIRHLRPLHRRFLHQRRPNRPPRGHLVRRRAHRRHLSAVDANPQSARPRLQPRRVRVAHHLPGRTAGGSARPHCTQPVEGVARLRNRLGRVLEEHYDLRSRGRFHQAPRHPPAHSPMDQDGPLRRGGVFGQHVQEGCVRGNGLWAGTVSVLHHAAQQGGRAPHLDRQGYPQGVRKENYKNPRQVRRVDHAVNPSARSHINVSPCTLFLWWQTEVVRCRLAAFTIVHQRLLCLTFLRVSQVSAGEADRTWHGFHGTPQLGEVGGGQGARVRSGDGDRDEQPRRKQESDRRLCRGRDPCLRSDLGFVDMRAVETASADSRP